jgi:uncharacterized protein YndB with AHSA1/START domain
MTTKNNQIEPLVIERTFNAPIALVWKAITTKEEMKRWSFDIKEFKPDVGFEFQFYGEKDGVKYLHRCKVTEVIPEKKLAYVGAMRAMTATPWSLLNYLLREIKPD